MYRRFNSNGVKDTTFNVITTVGGTGGEVIIPDYQGKILIGGNESIINNKEPSGNFAKLNQDGTTSSCGDTITYTLYLEPVYDNEPCTPWSMVHSIYLGSDGKYYLYQGDTYVLASTVSSTWFYNTGMFNDGFRDVYKYNKYIAIDGGFELFGTINSDCAPLQIKII